jgi:hypothetical protein
MPESVGRQGIASGLRKTNCVIRMDELSRSEPRTQRSGARDQRAPLRVAAKREMVNFSLPRFARLPARLEKLQVFQRLYHRAVDFMQTVTSSGTAHCTGEQEKVFARAGPWLNFCV